MRWPAAGLSRRAPDLMAACMISDTTDTQSRIFFGPRHRGRLVVPKHCETLGLYGGAELDARARDGRLEFEPVATPMHLERHGNGLVAVPEVELPVLTGEQVRETLEQTRS